MTGSVSRTAWTGHAIFRRRAGRHQQCPQCPGAFRHCVALCSPPAILPDLPGRAVVSSKPGLLSDATSFFPGALRYPNHKRDFVQRRKQNKKGDQSPTIGTAKSTFHAEIETAPANSCQRSDLHPPLSQSPVQSSSRSRPWQPSNKRHQRSPLHRRPALLPSQRPRPQGDLRQCPYC
jgi:hypothetical protein